MPQRGQRTALDDLTGSDDGHSSAQCLWFGQDVAGQQHRHAAVARFGNANVQTCYPSTSRSRCPARLRVVVVVGLVRKRKEIREVFFQLFFE